MKLYKTLTAKVAGNTKAQVLLETSFVATIILALLVWAING